MAKQPTPYPVRLNIDYPDRPLNRWSSFFRIIAMIPIWIIIALISGTNFSSKWGNSNVWSLSAAGGGIFLALVLMILFRQKYPRWWFDWNLALYRFTNRVNAYAALMRDEYPSTDEDQSVHFDIDYPNAKELNRWLPLIKWFLAIPHYVIMIFLILIAIVLVIISWFAIIFTGRYPKGIFKYVEGVMRWCNRVQAYAFLLVTDKYPPFSLD